jgi:hypothetical protein
VERLDNTPNVAKTPIRDRPTAEKNCDTAASCHLSARHDALPPSSIKSAKIIQSPRPRVAACHFLTEQLPSPTSRAMPGTLQKLLDFCIYAAALMILAFSKQISP